MTDSVDVAIQEAYEAGLRKDQDAITLGELVSGAIKPPPALFEGLLLHKTLTMVSAEPFSGKTLLMLAMAISLATGKALFGKYVPKQLCRVLFIGQDSPTWDYARQAHKLLVGYGVDPKDVKHTEVDLILNKGLAITDQRFRKWLELWHENVGFDVLMLDTLIDFHSMDENNNQQMSVVMNALKTIRDEFGCAVMFSHHVNKPSQYETSTNYRARGASKISGSVDFHFSLSRSGRQVNLLMPKARGADDTEPPPYFTIEQSTDEKGVRAVRLVTSDDLARERAVLGFIGAPKKRSEIIAYILVKEPGLGPERTSKWTDNVLQSFKQQGKAKEVERGVWQAVKP